MVLQLGRAARVSGCLAKSQTLMPQDHRSLTFLERIGWPSALVSQMRQVWSTSRFIEYDGHVHSEILKSNGVPQGCPLAPLTLACWMTAGHRSVNTLLHQRFGFSQREVNEADVASTWTTGLGSTVIATVLCAVPRLGIFGALRWV